MFDDIIIYTNPAKTQECIIFAEQLGSKKPLILFETHHKENKEQFAALKGKHLTSGIKVNNTKEAQRFQNTYDCLIGKMSRELVETKLVEYITGAETLETKDKTHHRASGMNQVTAKLLAKKTYLFDISQLFGNNRAQVLGRMQQNKRLLEKYGAPMMCCSYAKTPLDLRAHKERALLLETM